MVVEGEVCHAWILRVQVDDLGRWGHVSGVCCWTAGPISSWTRREGATLSGREHGRPLASRLAAAVPYSNMAGQTEPRLLVRHAIEKDQS